MQPDLRRARISGVWPRLRLLALCLLIALPLVAWGACAADGTAEITSPETRQPTPSAPSASADSGAVDELSPFPLLVPSLGFDTYSSDCEIGEDPFSSCQ